MGIASFIDNVLIVIMHTWLWVEENQQIKMTVVITR